MTALDHLRKLVERRLLYPGECPDCKNWISLDRPEHKSDCPWVAAKAHVEQWDEANRLNTQRLSRDTADMPPVAPDARQREALDARHRKFVVDDDREALERIAATFPPDIEPPDRKRIEWIRSLRKPSSGFTLIELLVVILIIGIVSAVALPTVLPAMAHRQVSEAARTLQGSLAGSRDAAIRDNATAGIRLVLDPVTPGAVNRIIPLQQPPAYSTGVVQVAPKTAYPATVMIGTLALVLEEQPMTAGLPNEPTSWVWNVRVGDKVQINQAGPWMSVAGPTVIGINGPTVWTDGNTYANPEGFINYGPPGATSPLGHDYLLLTNGRDDNANGWADDGWDGVDNNNDGNIDEPAEWEQETWTGALAHGVTGASYAVRRRPLPGISAREIALPSGVVIDLSRSNLPVVLDLLCQPDGTWLPSLPWGVPTSIGMSPSWFQFWLAERGDVGVTPKGQNWLVSLNGKTGIAYNADQPDLKTGLVAARQGP